MDTYDNFALKKGSFAATQKPKTSPMHSISSIHRPLPVPRKKKERAATPTHSPTNSPPSSCQKIFTPIDESKEMTLTEFVNSFSASLPQRIRVTKGVYGEDDESTISSADELLIHSIVHREVVKVSDGARGQDLTIPVNSILKFSPIYNPNNDTDEAFRGFMFPRTSNIMGRRPMPQFVCSTCAVNTGNASSSIIENEILVVDRIVEVENGGGKKLKVYSVTNSTHKVLDEDCAGHFTTTPSYLQLRLFQLIRSVHHPFPMAVTISADPDLAARLPDDLLTHITVVKRVTTDVVLVATTRIEQEGEVLFSDPYEVPTDLDTEIRVLHLSEEGRKALCAQSDEVREELERKGKGIRHYHYINISDDDYQLQVEIYGAVSGSVESLGTLSRKKSSCSHVPPPLDSPDNGVESDSDSDHYELPLVGNRLGTRKQLFLLDRKSKSTDGEVKDIRDKMMASQEELQSLTKSLQAQLMEQKRLTHALQSKVDAMHSKIDSLSTERTANSVSSLEPPTTPVSGDVSQRNRVLLSKATTGQVCAHTYIMHAYIQKYMHEHIFVCS